MSTIGNRVMWKHPQVQILFSAPTKKYLLHHIGHEDMKETVLTRFEYEQRLNSLREYIKQS